MDENVLVFSIFPGIQKRIFRNILDSTALRGIVMRTFGSGNAPHNDWLMPLLKRAAQRGVTVVNISQCVAGSVVMNRYDTGYQLMDLGVVSGHDGTVEAAITKLMFLQGMYSDANIIRGLMNQSLAGEIS